MRTLLWVSRTLLFLFLFAFAVRNTDPVAVRFFFDLAWHAPLVIVLLSFFVGGAMLAVLSLLATIFRLRRELAGARRELEQARSVPAGEREHPV